MSESTTPIAEPRQLASPASLEQIMNAVGATVSPRSSADVPKSTPGWDSQPQVSDVNPNSGSVAASPIAEATQSAWTAVANAASAVPPVQPQTVQTPSTQTPSTWGEYQQPRTQPEPPAPSVVDNLEAEPNVPTSIATEAPTVVPRTQPSTPTSTADLSNTAAQTTVRRKPATVSSRGGYKKRNPTERSKPTDTLAATVMIIDDEPCNVLVVRRYLEQAGYQNVRTTSESVTAFRTIQECEPDLILLDLNMPHVSGLDILKMRQCDRAVQFVPVLVMTASTDAETKQKALQLGATDFLPKPLDPNDLLPRVNNALTTKAFHDQLSQQNERLEEEVHRRTAELEKSRREVLHCLARAGEYRDDDTGHHVLRVGKYAAIIGKALGFNPERVELLELAAQLHDIGKIAVPDAILHKPGKLDTAEYDLMKHHCAFGKRIIHPYTANETRLLRNHASLGDRLLRIGSSPLLILAARIAQTHHERWDGSGYPLGLAGGDIPIEGRITAVADVFDALSSKRPYKDAFPRKKCFQILEEGRGNHFDPEVLDAFFSSIEAIIQVQIEYMDSPPEVDMSAYVPKDEPENGHSCD